MDRKDLLIEEARTWLGTPWVHNQRLKGHAVDCVQFICACAESVGLDYGKLENYYRSPEGNSLVDAIARVMDEIPKTEIDRGDVVVIRVGRIPHHVGIMTSPNTIIHADMRVMRVVEHDFGYLIRHTSNAFRIRD